MADETTKVLIDVDIQATDALQQLTDLKQKAADLRKEQDELDLTTAEGKKKFEELAQQIKAVNSAANERSKIIQNEIKQQNEQKNSLDQLGQKYSALRKQYRQLSEEQRNSPAGEKMVEELRALNEELKAAEAAYGSHQRNVGNYEGAISKLFPHFSKLQDTLSKLGINVTNVTNNFNTSTTTINKGLAGFGTSLKSAGKSVVKFGLQLMATPLGWIAAALAALVAVFAKLRDAIKKNDDAGTALQKLFASFQPILTAINKGFEVMAIGVGKAADALASLIARFSDSAAAAQDYIVEQDKLEDTNREFVKNEADRNKEIAKLRADAANKDAHTAEERAELLQQAMDLEKANMEDRKDIAKREYEILKQQAEQTADTSDAMKDKLADAYAKMINAETEYYQGTLRINSQLSSAREQAAKEEQANAKAAAESRKKAQKAASDAAIAEINFKQQIADEDAALEELFLGQSYAARAAWDAKEFARKEQAEREKLDIQLKYNQISREKYDENVAVLNAQSTTFYAKQKAAMEAYYAEAMEAAKAMLADTEKSEKENIEKQYKAKMDVLQEQQNALNEEYDKLREKQMQSLTAGDVWMDANKAMTEEEIARLREVEDQLKANADIQAALNEQQIAETAKVTKKYTDARAAEIAAEKDLDVLKLKNREAGIDAIYQAEIEGLTARMALYDEESIEYQQLLEKKKAADKEYQDAKKNAEQEAYEQSIQSAQTALDGMQKAMDVASAINEAITAQENAELERFEEQQDTKKKVLEKRLDQGLISQAEYEQGVQSLDNETEKQQKEISIKQAKRQKAMNLMNAAMNTASAILNIWAQVPKFDFGASTIALTAVAAAIGAAQMAAIAAQPIPKAAKGGIAGGGFLQGPSHAEGGIHIEAEGGEAIINKRSTAKYRSLLSAINADQGGRRFATGGIVGGSINDGGYTLRHSAGGLIPSAMDIADAISNVQIYTAVTDINRGQGNYAQVINNSIY